MKRQIEILSFKGDIVPSNLSKVDITQKCSTLQRRLKPHTLKMTIIRCELPQCLPELLQTECSASGGSYKGRSRRGQSPRCVHIQRQKDSCPAPRNRGHSTSFQRSLKGCTAASLWCQQARSSGNCCHLHKGLCRRCRPGTASQYSPHHSDTAASHSGLSLAVELDLVLGQALGAQACP